jgi:hypothetical protein
VKAAAAIVLLLLFLCPFTICGQTPAIDSLNKGTRAFDEAKYSAAVERFKKAIEQDPDLTIAELRLATVYRELFIPNGASAENMKLAELLIESYEEYLWKDPKNLFGLVGVATIHQNILIREKAVSTGKPTKDALMTEVDALKAKPGEWVMQELRRKNAAKAATPTLDGCD